ncbi:MAG TPA: DUF481 domain-containing protein [Gammaproteobacteria bacterium]|nr:DUF481 domain-containing protein [Gammaproteobacteria bacterium]
MHRFLRTIPVLALPLAAAAHALPNADPEAANGKEKLWETEAELGLTTSSGNADTTTTTGRVASDRTGERFALHLLAEGRYSEEDGSATSQRAHGLGQLDYNLQPRLYTFGVVEATHDRFAGYDARLQEAVGLGRHMLDRDDMAWRIEGGPALRQEWQVDDTYENSVRARLRTLYTWNFREASRFSQELVYNPSLENGDDYLLTSETALSFRLNSRIAFKTSVKVEHDSQPVAGAEKTDVFTTTSLLFHF